MRAATIRFVAANALLAAAATCAAPAHHTTAAPKPAAAPRYAELFVRLGCAECHAVSALGVRASHDVGPDLTNAYTDVVTRYGVSLGTFLANPTGVMRLMLVAHLNLTVADRDSILQILKGLHSKEGST